MQGLQEQLHTLQQLGITVREGVTTANLLKICSEEEILRHPYWALLVAMGGQHEDWPYMDFKDDWADPEVMVILDRLLQEREPAKGFVCLTWESQACLFGCATVPQFYALREMTGLAFEWITSEPIQKHP